MDPEMFTASVGFVFYLPLPSANFLHAIFESDRKREDKYTFDQYGGEYLQSLFYLRCDTVSQ